MIRAADANKVTQIWNNAFSNRPATSIGQIGAEELRGWEMIDCIQGRDGRVYAVIDYFPDSNVEHCFNGKIIEYNFPDELAALIDEYVSLVDGVVLSLLDGVEERIHEHGLMLKGKGAYIFNLEIYKKTDVVFFDRYPTGRGFLDELHNNPKSG
ncbi:hypothetical protein ACN8ZM_18935 [Burkholderia aenigmatica]|uniref:hypothetical protein n=1 Tax=Burkholderia aenigmatica TaxID=2015348 RepID=UPI003B42A075